MCADTKARTSSCPPPSTAPKMANRWWRRRGPAQQRCCPKRVRLRLWRSGRRRTALEGDQVPCNTYVTLPAHPQCIVHLYFRDSSILRSSLHTHVLPPPLPCLSTPPSPLNWFLISRSRRRGSVLGLNRTFIEVLFFGFRHMVVQQLVVFCVRGTDG